MLGWLAVKSEINRESKTGIRRGVNAETARMTSVAPIPAMPPGDGGASGLGGLLMAWWRRSAGYSGRSKRSARLTLIQRIPLGPRQTLALVEADGLHLLVATSHEGSPTVYPLSGRVGISPLSPRLQPGRRSGRVSW